MRFLHTADLHLDSPFCSLGAESAEKRRERQRKVLENIFALAKEKECQMMLMAGDIFDGSFVKKETENLLCRLVEEIGIPVVVSPGNHDAHIPSSVWAREDLPENLYVFSSKELQTFDFPELGAEVFGYAFTSAVLGDSPLSEAEPPEKGEALRLLCAHGDLGAPISRYAPMSDGAIDKFGFDYCALGHIHKRSESTTVGGSLAVYCGFAEGRSFDEEGEGFVYIVDAEDGNITATPVQVSENMYISESLSVDGLADRADLADRIKSALQNERFDKNTHVRLVLTGAADGELMYGLDALGEELGAGLASLDIRDETLCLPNAAYLENDITIRGELYRTLLPMLSSGSAEERRRAVTALNIGLAAIDGRSVFGGK